MTASEDQARTIRRRHGEEFRHYRNPEWRTNPSTASERQAAAILADAEGWDDEAEYRDAVEHPRTDRNRRRDKGGERRPTASEQQAAALLGTDDDAHRNR